MRLAHLTPASIGMHHSNASSGNILSNFVRHASLKCLDRHYSIRLRSAFFLQTLRSAWNGSALMARHYMARHMWTGHKLGGPESRKGPTTQDLPINTACGGSEKGSGFSLLLSNFLSPKAKASLSLCNCNRLLQQ